MLYGRDFQNHEIAVNATLFYTCFYAKGKFDETEPSYYLIYIVMSRQFTKDYVAFLNKIVDILPQKEVFGVYKEF